MSVLGDDGTGNGDTLLLTTREEESALTDVGIVTFRELVDEAVGLGAWVSNVHLQLYKLNMCIHWPSGKH